MKFHIAQIVTLALIANSIAGAFFVEMPAGRFDFFHMHDAMDHLFTFSLFLAVFVTSFILLQALLASLYRPVKRKSREELPSCTVLIPAFNEGKAVYDTIECVLQSDFPPEKMEVIVIDDGSDDDTWEWILKAVQKYPERVRGLRQEVNSGKKRALCRGIAESRNEIIITVDSDSLPVKNAVSELLIPFNEDPAIGAVAGNIRVRNLQSGLIPRMLDVAFVFGCDFMRCAQSVTSRVLCTPGAVSAYRKSAVAPLCDKWIHQSFLKAPATIGEDRALTSLLLRNGYKVICQNNAIAYTEVPASYRKLCLMLLRWTRGDIRESILLLPYVFSRFSLLDWRWTLFQLNVISQIVGVLLPLVYIPCTVLSFIAFRDHLLFILYYFFAMNGIWSLLPAAVYARRAQLSGALWAFVYGLFNAAALSWICIYSLATLRNSKWLTRKSAGKKKDSGPEQDFILYGKEDSVPPSSGKMPERNYPS